MVDITTLKGWAEGLGLQVEVVGEGADKALRVAPASPDAPRFDIRPSGTAIWYVNHLRRIKSADVKAQWAVPDRSEGPVSLFARTLRQLSFGFPLLDVDVTEEKQYVAVAFGAPVYGEDITRQAFCLTLSSVIKAVEAFDSLVAERKRQVASWAELEARSAELKKQYEKFTHPPAGEPSRQRTGPAGPTVATPGRSCPKCGRAIPVGKKFCTYDGTPIPTST